MSTTGLIKNQRVTKDKLERSRGLRREMTRAESVFWSRVRNRQFNNLKFRRQQIIDGFIVDFYCEELRLCVEIDGDAHETTEQQSYDNDRDIVLQQQGLRIMRFTNTDVLNDVEAALKRILAE